MKITRKVLEKAPMFTIFRALGNEVEDPKIDNSLWRVVALSPVYSDSCLVRWRASSVARVVPWLALQCADHQLERYRDVDVFDIALDALLSGVQLIKVPETMEGVDWAFCVCFGAHNLKYLVENTIIYGLEEK